MKDKIDNKIKQLSEKVEKFTYMHSQLKAQLKDIEEDIKQLIGGIKALKELKGEIDESKKSGLNSNSEEPKDSK